MGIPPRRHKGGLTRRDFLGMCGCTSALLLPAPLYGPAAIRKPQSLWKPRLCAASAAMAAVPPPYADYRIVPHYPVRSPLEELIRKARQNEDDFPSERFSREIEAQLAQWGSALRKSPNNVRMLAQFLSPQLAAASPRPQELHEIRGAAALKLQRASFSTELSLGRDAFLDQLQSTLERTSEILTAEFKVADLEMISTAPPLVKTQVRFVLVGTGVRLYRLERIGVWEIEWEHSAEGGWVAKKWQPLSEIQSFCAQPIFVDITSSALKGVSSYHTQMLRGTDYWRTVLDGATGIDTYGNNGIAAADYDNDGFDDLYICQPSGIPNRLYRNRGDGTFEDVTEAAGVDVLDNSPCALFADIRNIGLQDLVVITANGPLLFLNQGNGKFKLKPQAFHFARPSQGTFTGAAFGDYDRDGRLDIYFCLYSYYKGLEQYHFPLPYYDARNGPPNFLFHNEGDATFRDVTEATGLNQNNDRFSFDCTWCDYDIDGWPDLYVVNDFGRKNLYHNDRNGKFTDVAEEVGVVDVGPGMSSCWFDYDNDLNFDLYVSDMWETSGMRLTSQTSFLERMPPDVRALVRHHAKGNSLFRNLGNGRFEDRSAAAGVEQAGWSWSCHAWDFAHDGRSHLYIANGMISGPTRDDLESFFWQHVVAQSPPDAHPTVAYELGWNAINELIRSDGTWAGYLRNVFFFNNGDGTFSDISGAVGLDFQDDSRAFALADFDHDGRLEIALKNRTGPQLRILRSEAPDLGNALALRLRGTKSNRDAVGAVIILTTTEGRQVKMLQAGTGFPSQHSKEVFFGIGKAASASAEIRWPNGDVQHFEGLPANHRIEIEEGSEKFQAVPFRPHRPLAAIPPPPTAEPPPASSETWLVDPILAPDFELPDLSGLKHRLSDVRGKLVALNFWATGSPPSLETLRVLDRSVALRKALELLAVNLDKPEDATQVRSFARANSLRLPVLLASDEVAGIYNLVYHFMFDRRRNLGLPTTFLIDSKGFIVKVYQGAADAARLTADCDRIPQTAEERIKLALPFPGTLHLAEFRRNEFTYGAAFSQAGYYDQAIQEFNLALETDPDYAEAHYNLGTLYLKQGKADEARRHLERALELRHEYPDALNNLGLLAVQAGDSAQAIRFFQQAIDQRADYALAYYNLGNVYRREQRFTEAKQALDRAVALAPDDPEVNYGAGMLYAQLNETDRALKYWQHALEIRPDYPEALNNLGVLFVHEGKTADAQDLFARALHAAADFDQPYLNLARLYVGQGEKDRAREILQQLLARHPDHAMAKSMLEKLGR
ncbi:TPR repeat-containing protein [Acidobacteriia bacterium SbA2]|nr:TPR repeat-containing protein [Acidobacteriia bacterium SbA2]